MIKIRHIILNGLNKGLTSFYSKTEETRALMQLGTGIVALMLGSLLAIVLFFSELKPMFFVVSGILLICLGCVLWDARKKQNVRKYHYFIVFLATYIYGLYIFIKGDNEKAMVMFGLAYPILSISILRFLWGNLLIGMELATSLLADYYLNPRSMSPETRLLYICLYLFFWQISVFMEGANDFTVKRMLEQRGELVRLANCDQLTSLSNRRSFYNQIQENFSPGKFSGPIALMIMDVDNFKSINDRYGHNAGDRVLVEVADRIRKNTRSTDICCRWGGEEFLVLAPLNTEADCRAFSQKICDAIGRQPIKISDDQELSVTVSVGAVFTLCYEDTSTEELVKNADERLYQAKAAGKNRICAGTLCADLPCIQ